MVLEICVRSCKSKVWQILTVCNVTSVQNIIRVSLRFTGVRVKLVNKISLNHIPNFVCVIRMEKIVFSIKI